MPSIGIEIDSGAFVAGMAAAVRDLKLESEAFIEHLGEKLAERAKVLAPKRTMALADSIHVTSLVRAADGAYVEVVAGTREAVYMEFGTYKDRARPFMRPAAAEVAGALRGAGYVARLSSGQQARMAVRRAKARAVVRSHRRRGLLTAAQARQASVSISARLQFRGRGR